MVSDAGWREGAEAGTSAVARRLLAAVLAASSLRFDAHLAGAPAADRPALGKAKDEVDKGMLARAAQVHTSSGQHATVLSTWESWASPEVVAAAARMELEQARRELAEAVAGCPTPLTSPPSPASPLRSQPARKR